MQRRVFCFILSVVLFRSVRVVDLLNTLQVSF